MHPNPATWLRTTDLVFIDPVGTGFSRPVKGLRAEEEKKSFYNATADVHYLSRVIYDWLVTNRRLQSPKFIVGESYGGYRAPEIVYYMQTQMGVAFNGMILMSPYFLGALDVHKDVSPLYWIVNLPSIAASQLERKGKLTASAMQGVIDYARGDYALALLKGNSDPQAEQLMYQHVAALTGLSLQDVAYAHGRITPNLYISEIDHDMGRLGSLYDPNVTAVNPSPADWPQFANDPILQRMIAPTTTAMVDFVTKDLGFKSDSRYYALNYNVNSAWEWEDSAEGGAIGAFRSALANDPHLMALIDHGWNDLA